MNTSPHPLFPHSATRRRFLLQAGGGCGALVFLWLLTAAAPTDDKKDPPPLKLSDDEKTLLDLTNAERAKEKLPPLTANPLLFQAARAMPPTWRKKAR